MQGFAQGVVGEEEGGEAERGGQGEAGQHVEGLLVQRQGKVRDLWRTQRVCGRTVCVDACVGGQCACVCVRQVSSP